MSFNSIIHCRNAQGAWVQQTVFDKFSKTGAYTDSVLLERPDIPDDEEELFKWCQAHLNKALPGARVVMVDLSEGFTALFEGILDGQSAAVQATLIRGSYANFHVCSSDFATARKLAEVLGEGVDMIPRPNLPKSMVPMALWREDEYDGASYDTKNIYCPTFDEIRVNYGTDVQRNFDRLTILERPDEVGKIILWHGPPGTGKTHCVRALARDWHHRLKATVEVILDPEEMFKNVKYMHSLLLSNYAPDVRAEEDEEEEDENEEAIEEAPLRLIIIEDSAELFRKGCRNTQGFARFLNLTDGLIGQGLRCVFLLTANEQIEEIDPAVIRAGRCLQLLKYNELEPAEIQAWADANNFVLPASPPSLLADLYAQKNKTVVTV